MEKPLYGITAISRMEDKSSYIILGSDGKKDSILDPCVVTMADEDLLEYRSFVRKSKSLPSSLKSELEVVFETLQAMKDEKERLVY